LHLPDYPDPPERPDHPETKVITKKANSSF